MPEGLPSYLVRGADVSLSDSFAGNSHRCLRRMAGADWRAGEGEASEAGAGPTVCFFYICSRTPMGGWVNKNGGTCGKRAVSPWTFWISHGLTRRHGWWFDYVRLIKIWFNDPTWGFFEKNGGEEDTYFEMLPCSFLRLQLTSPCLNINIMQEHAWDMYLW